MLGWGGVKMLINGYPIPNFILLLLFFALMWVDKKLMDKGEKLFLINKIVCLFSVFGSFALTEFKDYSWYLVIFIACYSVFIFLLSKKNY